MLIKKKQGVILLEVNIFLMIILAIFTASCKVFISNIEKSKYLYLREDIKAISYLEYEFLYDFNEFVSTKKEEYLSLKSKGDTVVYTNMNYKNYSVIYKGENFYITYKKTNDIRYIGIDEKVDNDKIYFITNTYKTDYIN